MSQSKIRANVLFYTTLGVQDNWDLGAEVEKTTFITKYSVFYTTPGREDNWGLGAEYERTLYNIEESVVQG